MKTTPSILAFHRDMLLNIPTFTDLKNIQYMRQQQVNKDVQRQNKNRNKYQFKANDQVLITPSTHIQRKLNPKFSGPYTIVNTHENNTITIKRKNNITERINIRRVKPYHKEE
jgi:transposase